MNKPALKKANRVQAEVNENRRCQKEEDEKGSSVDNLEQGGSSGAAKTTDSVESCGNDKVEARSTTSVQRQTLFVAAIDFGTTFSGFAYSMLNDYNLDRLKILTKENWLTNGGGLTAKTPSAILFKPNKSFHSFGYKAESDYNDLFWDEDPIKEENPKNWYFFRNYKMFLYKNQILKRDTVLTEEGGKTLPAIYVFSQSIKFLRDTLFENLKERISGIGDNDIFWVLTVPAIWSDKAKQFMREAAVKAGIPGENLTLALEPEAAAVYCKHLLLEKVHDDDAGTRMTSLPPGTCFMVVDLGGGTIDLTVYEISEEDVLNEIHPANGDNCGGNLVNIAFLELVEILVGQNSYSKFKACHGGEFLHLEQNFEYSKRRICKNTINLPFPPELVDIWEEINRAPIADHFRKMFPGGEIVFKKGKLCLTRDKFKSLFRKTITEISHHIADVLNFLPLTQRPKTVLLVGGFADCDLVQDDIRRNFPDMRVVVPEEAVMAVMKGAVLFGRDPSIISGRVLKHSYGIDCWPPFREGEHPADKKKCINGKWKCRDVFRKHVEAGSVVKVGAPLQEIKYNVIDNTQDEMCLPVFVSTEKSPTYVTDDSCMYLGTLNIDMKDTTGGGLRSVQVRMIFEGTEFAVEARDEATGKIASTKVDFLG